MIKEKWEEEGRAWPIRKSPYRLIDCPEDLAGELSRELISAVDGVGSHTEITRLSVKMAIQGKLSDNVEVSAFKQIKRSMNPKRVLSSRWACHGSSELGLSLLLCRALCSHV